MPEVELNFDYSAVLVLAVLQQFYFNNSSILTIFRTKVRATNNKDGISEENNKDGISEENNKDGISEENNNIKHHHTPIQHMIFNSIEITLTVPLINPPT